LLAVGNRMPDWVGRGFEEYARRLPQPWSIELHEIAPGNRRSGDNARAVNEEGERMLKAIPENATVVMLDILGKAYSSEALARRFGVWRQQAPALALLVGGPQGLAPSCRERARESWSLGPLTLPHPLVRVVLAEQIYRVWSVIHHHPYHRA